MKHFPTPSLSSVRSAKLGVPTVQAKAHVNPVKMGSILTQQATNAKNAQQIARPALRNRNVSLGHSSRHSPLLRNVPRAHNEHTVVEVHSKQPS